MKVNFKYVGEFEAPKRGSEHSAGIDLFNNTRETICIESGKSAIVQTGFFAEIPVGYVGFVIARSSLGFKYDCTLTNAVGVIDADYRGEVKVKITNLSDKVMEIEPNMRVAQFLIVPCFMGKYVQVEKLSETIRGENGFGSTGK